MDIINLAVTRKNRSGICFERKSEVTCSAAVRIVTVKPVVRSNEGFPGPGRCFFFTTSVRYVHRVLALIESKVGSRLGNQA
ncbi:hypothetical protein N9N28_08010 [Rubripirellula amarantea]|uniref:Uncharacterized protein n=1 Tax=Rubripirellula amarantea TaxID=2527999 RepID=A0A5C5WQA2_9BACT|nr:hypothetical protein [Rubripirellula amarantea]TWT53074.1 hypothetical protein Pla22_07020 [Rubripirellula amarantea]